MELRLDYFMEALSIMGSGMLGIFAVTGVIIGLVRLLNKLTAGNGGNSPGFRGDRPESVS